MNQLMRTLPILAVVLALQGCVNYQVRKPISASTTTRIASSGKRLAEPRLTLEADSRGAVSVRSESAFTGPEEAVTTTQNEKYARMWSPLFIPWGAFFLVLAPIGVVVDLMEEQAMFTENQKYPHCWSLIAACVHGLVGIWPNPDISGEEDCRVGYDETTTATLTGRQTTATEVWPGAAVALAVSAHDASGAVMLREEANLTTDEEGHASWTGMAGFVARLRESPARIQLEAVSTERPGVRSSLVLDREASKALFAPVGAGRACASAEQEGEAALATDPSAALEKLLQAMKACQAGSRDRVRGKVIMAALALSPSPEVSEEARHLANRGRAFAKEAKGPSDFRRAAAELQEAVDKAPWWASGYYNLALAQEKAEDHAGALANYRWYLKASPGAQDADEVNRKIAEMEVAQELKRGKHRP